MHSLSTLVFLYLSISVSQKLGGEASPCGIPLPLPLTFTQIETDRVQTQVDYECTKTALIPVCFGGCAATMEYTLHVQDSSSSKSRCSVDVHQCKATGTYTIQSSWDQCIFVSNGTVAPNPNVYDFVRKAATGCSCQRLYYPNTASASDCENRFVVN